MPTVNKMIQFKYGLQTNYDKITTKDLNTLYFTTDTQRLFVGETEYSRPVQHGAALPTGYAPANSLFVLENGTRRELHYSKDGTAWDLVAVLSATIAAGVVGANTAGALEFGGTIKVPKVTYDARGNITAAEDVELTLPTETPVNITATKGTGSGNAVTEITATGSTITYKMGETFATKESVDTLAEKPAMDITATQITNWDGEVGAKAAAQAAQNTADSKVASVKALDKSITIDGTTTAPTVGVAISTTAGNTLTLDTNGLFVPTPPAATVVGVKAGEKVLSLDSDKNLGTTLSLDYDSTNKKIQLKGIGDTLVADLDATAFIKDGMLDNAELKVATAEHPVGTHTSGTFLVLTFNTDAGKEEIDIDVTSLIDTYTAGNGITITDHTVSVKKDTESEAFLDVTAAGVKVTGVQTAIDTAKNAVLGTTGDASTEATVYGARALATAAKTAADNAATAAGKVNLTQSGTDGHKLTFTNSAGTASDITIPDADTTYTFANGADGSFTVTPKGGDAQKVSIGKPATAGTADEATHAVSADEATKATQDGAGNVIVDTYATKEEVTASTIVWGSF